VKGNALRTQPLGDRDEVCDRAAKPVELGHDQAIAFAHELQRRFKLIALQYGRSHLPEDLCATRRKQLRVLRLVTRDLVTR
jgi:hypothetical protein